VRSTAPVDIQVVGVRSQGDSLLRDIKPPVRVGGGIPLWAVVAVVICVVGLIGAGTYWWMMHRDRPVPVAAPPPPIDHAAEFVRIAGLGLLERGEYKQYYALLADNLRGYLELRLGVEAMELTTAEIVDQLRAKDLGWTLIGGVESFLGTADLVKFAKMVPDMDHARRAPEAGVALVQRIDRWAADQRAAARHAEMERAREGALPPGGEESPGR